MKCRARVRCAKCGCWVVVAVDVCELLCHETFRIGSLGWCRTFKYHWFFTPSYLNIIKVWNTIYFSSKLVTIRVFWSYITHLFLKFDGGTLIFFLSYSPFVFHPSGCTLSLRWESDSTTGFSFGRFCDDPPISKSWS